MKGKFHPVCICVVALILVATMFYPFLTSPTVAQSLPTYLPPWQQSIAKINIARDQGGLTVDEAALYRLTAIRAPFDLPAQFQPNTAGPDGPLPRSDLWVLSQKLDALFADKAQWRATTMQQIDATFNCL